MALFLTFFLLLCVCCAKKYEFSVDYANDAGLCSETGFRIPSAAPYIPFSKDTARAWVSIESMCVMSVLNEATHPDGTAVSAQEIYAGAYDENSELCMDGDCYFFKSPAVSAQINFLASLIDWNDVSFDIEVYSDYSFKITGVINGDIEDTIDVIGFGHGAVNNNKFEKEYVFSEDGVVISLIRYDEDKLCKKIFSTSLAYAQSISTNIDMFNYKNGYIYIDKKIFFVVIAISLLAVIGMVAFCVIRKVFQWICCKENKKRYAFEAVNVDSMTDTES